MSAPISWLVVMVVAVGALYRGMQFRRGTNRDLLGLYRAESQPAVYRHIPLLLPFAGGFVVAMLLLAALAISFSSAKPGEPDVTAGIVATSGLVLLFWLFGLAIFLMYRPPSWMIPSWLVEADVEIGYLSPKPGWFDKGALLVATASILLGALSMGYAAWKFGVIG